MATRLIPMAYKRLPKQKKPINQIPNFRLYPGDNVQVISGPHKGKQAILQEIIQKQNRVVLTGVNMRERHVRATAGGAASRSYMKESPMHYSNVNLVCPSTGKPTRVGIRYLENGERVRVAKRSGVIVPKPEVEEKNVTFETGPLDTPPELVLQETI